MLGAIGVVYGDIGTSPLYAFKESLAGHYPVPIDQTHIFGVLSLIFWILLLVVTIKYVIITMRADNHGEGGSLALLAMLDSVAKSPKLRAWVMVMGLSATGLFYGDSVITPAISVLSAVEGLNVISPALESLVLPITLVILVMLFVIQSRGTTKIGVLFGPIMTVWFVTIGGLGLFHIVHNTDILQAINPKYALFFLKSDGKIAFLILASVLLAVTGAEALYADMGHFGRKPIRLSWYVLVWPALVLNYFGQGALLLNNSAAISHPFYAMAPDNLRVFLVILATFATIVASQATITGAFSITHQAIQLGYLPRMRIVHTSHSESGQIYLPAVNYAMMAMVIGLVIGFGSSSNLASAYGIAVAGTMLLTTIMLVMLMRMKWHWSWWRVLPFMIVIATVDLGLFASSAVKILYGGWFPLLMGTILFVILTTWKKGRNSLRETVENEGLSAVDFIQENIALPKSDGVAVYLSRSPVGLPLALYQNVKHNHVLHEKILILSVVSENVPFIQESKQVEFLPRGHSVYRMILHKGFMQTSNVPKVLSQLSEEKLGFKFDPQTVSYFVSRIHIQPTGKSPMKMWQKHLFAWMVHRATAAREFFNLPHNRVIELGTLTEL